MESNLAREFDFRSRRSYPMTACPICKAPQSSVIARRDRHGFPIQTRYCSNCCHMWLSPILCKEGWKEFYGKWYRRLAGEYRQKPQDVEAVLANQSRYGAQIVDIVSEHVSNGRTKKVLDLGGSTGAVSRMLAEEIGLCEITVVDPCTEELERASSIGVRVEQATAEEYPIAEGAWDVILLCRTLDHLVHPMPVLNAISKGLAKGGVAYVDYVSTEIVWGSEGFYNAFHLDHPQAFTATSFRTALGRAHLPPVVMNYPDGSSTVGAVCRSQECVTLAAPLESRVHVRQQIEHYRALERKEWVSYAR